MRRGSNLIGRLRLFSGLVLLTFVVSHLLNLSLGVISYEVLEEGRAVFIAVWRSLPGTVALVGAVAIHMALGLWKVLRLPSLRMPFWEFLQSALGLLIPVLLVGHVIGSRISHEVLGLDDNYAWELLALWSWLGVEQIGLVLVTWVHGCLGIHYWLRFRPWYSRAAPWLLGSAVAVPLLALSGFVSAGWEVQRLAAEQGWLAAKAQAGNWPAPEMFPTIMGYGLSAQGVVVGLLVLLLAARQVAVWRRQPRASVQITFGPRRHVHVCPGTTVLEASRLAGIPHASVCGGRGRCSTCRMRIGPGGEHLSDPNETELAVLRRIGAPPGVRLACQVRPERDIMVTPLLPPHVEPHDTLQAGLYQYGREMEIAVLFTDLRGFTTMTEKRLPYDVVFLMNRYFHAMGETIEGHGGHLVQVFGDGIMALFGLDEGVERGCRAALRVARSMAEKLDELNEHHPLDLAEPLRMGIGIHAGPAIVGEMGYHKAVILTAVGDAVNTTSRVQEATKEFACQLIVSRLAAEKSGVDFSAFPPEEMEVRGRTQPLGVHPVATARGLPEIPQE